ncbi:DNA processing protein DprA, partial [Brevibacterium paucivorans]
PHRLIAQGIASVVTNANDVRALSEKQPSSGSMPQLSAEAFRMDSYSAHVRAAHSVHRDL